MVQYLLSRRVAQHINVLLPHTLEAVAVGDIVKIALKPGKTVGERAVEIEYDEGKRRRDYPWR
jgi:hypothetical protein